jgi:hypothetical protein
MDDASPANIQRLIDAANACIEENLEALDCIAKKLEERGWKEILNSEWGLYGAVSKASHPMLDAVFSKN